MSNLTISTDKIADDQWIPLKKLPYINRLVNDNFIIIFSNFAPSLVCKRWQRLSMHRL